MRGGPHLYMNFCLVQYSGIPLNGHPSTADTHNITDNSESPDCPSIHFNTLETLNSGRPATPYSGHLSTQTILNNPDLVDTLSTFSAALSITAAGVNNFKLD